VVGVHADVGGRAGAGRAGWRKNANRGHVCECVDCWLDSFGAAAKFHDSELAIAEYLGPRTEQEDGCGIGLSERGKESRGTMTTYYVTDVEENEGRVYVCLSDDDRVTFTVESPASNRGVVILVDRTDEDEVIIPLDAVESVIAALKLVLKRSREASE
jgi:hypothetical protein